MREERATVVAGLIGEPRESRTVHAHLVEVDIAVALAREHEPLAVRAQRALGVVAVAVRQALQVTAVGLRRPDVVRPVDRPSVTLAHVGRRRARVAARVRRGEQHALVVIVEIAAGGAALAGAHQRALPGPEVIDVLLVARPLSGRRLKDEPGAVGAPVGLGVLAAERELPEMREVRFAGPDQRVGHDRGRRHGAEQRGLRRLDGLGRDHEDERQQCGAGREELVHVRVSFPALRSVRHPDSRAGR